MDPTLVPQGGVGGGRKHDPIKPTKKYSTTKTKAVRILYLLMIILWLALIYFLGLYQTHAAGYFILCIPIFFYLLGYYNSSSLTVEVEDKTFSMGYISIALLVVIPLVTWVGKNFYGNKWYLAKIVVTAVVLALISLIDMWVPPKWVSLVRHVKSALQTASLTLLVFALYTYYTGQQYRILLPTEETGRSDIKSNHSSDKYGPSS